MNFIKGLTGCALGFLGGTLVLGLMMPEQVIAGTGEALDYAEAPQAGEPFLRVKIEH